MTTNTKSTQITKILLARESNPNDRGLMEQMIHQTLEWAQLQGMTNLDDLMDAGMKAIDNPEAYRGKVLLRGRTRMVAFERAPVLVVLVMGSAALTDNDHGENEFTETLRNLILKLKPREVWTVRHDRLTRSPECYGRILTALRRANAVVVTREGTLDPSDTGGRVAAFAQALAAGFERDSFADRAATAWIYQTRKGRWPTPMSVPPGYTLDTERRPVIDPDQVDPVRRMLPMLADPNRSATRLVRELGALGITTRQLTARAGSEATVASAASAHSVLNSLLPWATAWRDLTWTFARRNPFPNQSLVQGIPVQHIGPDCPPEGLVTVTIDLPPPPGGSWASRDVLDSVVRRAMAAISSRRWPVSLHLEAKTPQGTPTVRRTGGSTHRRTAPLSGVFAWSDGCHEYRLFAQQDGYGVLRRSAGARRGWIGDSPEHRSAVPVAVVDREGLHRSLVEEITAALSRGVPATTDNDGLWILERPQVAHELSELDRQISSAQRTVANLKRAIRDATDTTATRAVATLVDELDDALADLDRLQDERERLCATIRSEEPPRRFTSTGELAVAALAVLERTRTGPYELAAALAEILRPARMTVTPTTVTWEVHVRLPTPTGAVILGPIRGTVPNEITRRSCTLRNVSHRRRDLVEALTAAGYPLPAARSASQCPDLRLCEALLGGAGSNPWAAWCRDLYRNRFPRWPNWAWRRPSDIQPMLDTLARHGGAARATQLVAAGFTPEQLRSLIRARKLRPPVATRTGRGDDAVYRLPACVHCGGHRFESCLVPETTGGLLCRTCRRLPGRADSPAFPDFYLLGAELEGTPDAAAS